MFPVNKGIWLIGIPIILSWITVLKRSVVLLVVLIAVHFLAVWLIPAFRGRESIWMFLVVTVTTIPINAYLLMLMNRWGFLFGSLLILGWLRCILYGVIFFCVEQIIMGVITRLIWKKQYKLII